MSVDIEFDDEIRASVAATRPERQPAIGQISARANTLRRHGQYRMAAFVAVVVLSGAGLAYALPNGVRARSLQVEAPHSHRPRGMQSHTTTVPTTVPPVQGGVPTTLGLVIVPPSIPGSQVSTPGSSPSASTPTTVNASTPTTQGTSGIAPPLTTGETSPTTQPPPNYPPVGAGHTRIVIVLDDAGLHAPASVQAGYGIEILFDDQRTNHKVQWELLEGGYGADGRNGWFGIIPWNATPDPNYTWQILANGGVLTFYDVVGAGACNCAWSGTPVHITITK
jgi:hypothetical protein